MVGWVGGFARLDPWQKKFGVHASWTHLSLHYDSSLASPTPPLPQHCATWSCITLLDCFVHNSHPSTTLPNWGPPPSGTYVCRESSSGDKYIICLKHGNAVKNFQVYIKGVRTTHPRAHTPPTRHHGRTDHAPTRSPTHPIHPSTHPPSYTHPVTHPHYISADPPRAGCGRWDGMGWDGIGLDGGVGEGGR